MIILESSVNQPRLGRVVAYLIKKIWDGYLYYLTQLGQVVISLARTVLHPHQSISPFGDANSLLTSSTSFGSRSSYILISWVVRSCRVRSRRIGGGSRDWRCSGVLMHLVYS